MFLNHITPLYEIEKGRNTAASFFHGENYEKV